MDGQTEELDRSDAESHARGTAEIERHSRARKVELSRFLKGRTKVYLDACFWIPLRDVALGVSSDPAAQKLLHHLRRGVCNGRLICPIGTGMFLELMKQPLFAQQTDRHRAVD